MSIQERKYSIIERIMRLSKPDLLRIESVLEDEVELNAALDKSLKQVEEGKIRPHNEVLKKYEKWL